MTGTAIEPAIAGEAGDEGRDPAGRFVAGVSGNPNGRRDGSRKALALALDAALAEGDKFQKLFDKMYEAALGGDTTANAFLLSRAWAPRRSAPIDLQFPPLSTPETVNAAVNEVYRAMGESRITAEDATLVIKSLNDARAILEATELAPKVREVLKAARRRKRAAQLSRGT